jgi:hypothetical protein
MVANRCRCTWCASAKSNRPQGEKPIEWLLLTNEPVQTLADAQRVVEWYERRWIIEEYHKGMKTGCGIEDLQFTAVERLEPAIALLSAVALTLLNLRDVSRRSDAHTRPATAVVAEEYVEVLSLWRHGKTRPCGRFRTSSICWPDSAATKTANATTAQAG